MSNVPNTAPSNAPGRHVAEDRMKITVPAGYTPAYFGRSEFTAVATDQPNEWLLLGKRPLLTVIANRIATLHYSVKQ